MLTRTKTSGSENNNFSSDEQIKELINLYAKRFNITKSSFLRLGVVLAARRLEKKQIEKGIKLIKEIV